MVHFHYLFMGYLTQILAFVIIEGSYLTMGSPSFLGITSYDSSYEFDRHIMLCVRQTLVSSTDTLPDCAQVKQRNSGASTRAFLGASAEHVTDGLNRSVVKRISLVTPVLALKALSEVPVHQNCVRVPVTLVQCGLGAVDVPKTSKTLCSPNEDFGRPVKHSVTYFQSTFQMNVAQI